MSFRTVSFRSSPPPCRPDGVDSRIRVLINGLHSKTGGGLTYLRNVLPLLEQDPSVEVHLCIHDEQESLLPTGLQRTHVHLFGFRQGFLRLLWREQVSVPRLARLLGADVIFSTANFGPLMVRNGVILLRNAPAVARVERRWRKWMYWSAVFLATVLSLLMARRAIAVSDYARRALSLGWLNRKVAVVPHGISKAFSPPNEGAARKDYILGVSDIYIQKNFEALIQAFARLHETRPALTLVIAGQPIDADYYAELLALVAELGLSEAVRFTGRVDLDTLVGLYRECAVFVFPSTVETFGNPLVEAMASGAPIASSDAAAMPEVVGDAALLFSPDNVDDLTAILERLMDDSALRADLTVKALKRAAVFSWERTVEKTVHVLRDAARASS